MKSPWTIIEGDSPLIATAIHAGHELRPEIARRVRLTSAERDREEDPHTEVFTCVAPTRVIAHRSRFEFDLNRSLEKSIYLNPADAWGLDVWNCALPADLIEESRALHRQFFNEMHTLIQRRIDRFGQVVILDIHSYNHLRDGADAPPAAPSENPQVNIGTGSMPAYRWDTLLQAFLAAFRASQYQGEPLDVRENVRFQGGYLSQWVHATFPEQACAIAIEFKKTFMDEWSGELNLPALKELEVALTSATGALLQVLEQRCKQSEVPLSASLESESVRRAI